MSLQKSASPQLRVLVVEDHAFLRKLLSESLQKTHEVYSAESLKAGWELYLRHAPDIIFLDINLPDGNGHQLARRIKERQPHAYVVMATASDQPEDAKEAGGNLVDGFMVKPFDKAMIGRHLDRCMKSRSSAARKG